LNSFCPLFSPIDFFHSFHFLTYNGIFIEVPHMSFALPSSPSPLHDSVSPKVFLAYLSVGIAALVMLLFPPQWLKSATARLPWSSQGLTLTPVSSTTLTSPTSSKSLCYAWDGLDAAQISLAQTLLTDNPLAQGLSIRSSAAPFGLAVTVPVDAQRRTALTSVLQSIGVDATKDMRLPNGIRAISVGSATSTEGVAALRTALNAKGLSGYNLVAFDRPVSQSVSFQSSSAAFVTQLNAFSKDKKIPPIGIGKECPSR
jgi:hypothetical protein